MFRPQRRSLVRDTVCVVLVVCLLMPTLGVAQTPQSPGTVEPRAPAMPLQVPSQQLPPPPPPDFPVRAPGGVAMPRGARTGKSGGDRKSTRLNSSHVRISYAVFCLKKKKKNKQN